MKNSFLAVFSCVGAMVGAGFASGREILVFFTQYGAASWWLIALSGTVIVWLCSLCMHTEHSTGVWTSIFGKNRWWAMMVSVCLMTLTAGAMVSAAGHMVALLWPSRISYEIGAVGTLLLSWGAGFGGARPVGWISAGLSILLLGVLLFAWGQPVTPGVVMAATAVSGVVRGGGAAMAYAAMNVMLALGMISRCTEKKWLVSFGTGGVLTVLMCVSNGLYLKHPELRTSSFPLVMLMRQFGRTAYELCIVLLYLSIFTTLSSVVYALRTAASRTSGKSGWFLGLAMPLLVSSAGFTEIVDRLYAPAGWICLLTLFLPLQLICRKQRGVDFCFPLQ